LAFIITPPNGRGVAYEEMTMDAGAPKRLDATKEGRMVSGTPLSKIAMESGSQVLALAALLADALAEVESVGAGVAALSPGNAVLDPSRRRVTLVGVQLIDRRLSHRHVEHIVAWLAPWARRWQEVADQIDEWSRSPPTSARAAAARLRAAVEEPAHRRRQPRRWLRGAFVSLQRARRLVGHSSV
jgi:hypothetical protein